jgi:hypothetical protein
MSIKADYIFEVHIRIPEAFTLDSIVRSPRTFKPKDVRTACHNNELVLKEGTPPPEVISMATYVMTDFFAMAHATGLYNRQREMWESLSKVNTIAVKQLSAGLLRKNLLPAFDLIFLDYKQKPLVYVGLITDIPQKETAANLLKQCISHASGKASLKGFLCCFRAPFPADAMQFVQKQTHTLDPVGRYESILPSLRVPVDLLEMNQTSEIVLSADGTEQSELRATFHLLHPDLRKSKTGLPPMPPIRRDKPKKSEPAENAENGELNDNHDVSEQTEHVEIGDNHDNTTATTSNVEQSGQLSDSTMDNWG